AAMLSSRWPRSPSHGKCSKRYCGSSRSYGRSHHQRQRETFDVMHSTATDRRSASKCQGKWPDQTRDQAFGLPEVLLAVSTSRLSCKRAGKTRTLMPVWDSSGESQTVTFFLCWEKQNDQRIQASRHVHRTGIFNQDPEWRRADLGLRAQPVSRPRREPSRARGLQHALADCRGDEFHPTRAQHRLSRHHL